MEMFEQAMYDFLMPLVEKKMKENPTYFKSVEDSSDPEDVVSMMIYNYGKEMARGIAQQHGLRIEP